MLRRQLERLERHPGLRAARDFQRAHAEAFEDLQQPVVGGRFHRDHVARAGHRAQRQVERLGTAVRDDDLLRRQLHPRVQRLARDGAAQRRMAFRLDRLGEQHRVPAQGARRGAAQRLGGIERGRAVGTAQVGMDMLVLAAGQQRRYALVDADVLRGIGQRGVGFGQRCQRRAHKCRDKIAGTRAGFEQAVALQLAAGLQRRGQADAVQSHQRAHRWHAVAGGQRAGFDGAAVVAGNLAVERGGFHGGMVARMARGVQIQMRGACIVTASFFFCCSGGGCAGVCLPRAGAGR
ncbi:hypothetical protein D9M68_706260 [compost metagenome]